jgi:uncharacterized protein (TIGR02145 family)
MKKNILFISILVMTSIAASAQVKVGDNPTTINGSAVLEIESTTKGMLLPRMTTAERTAIATPAVGLQVYDTTENANYFFDGTAWQKSATGTIKFVNGTTPSNAVYTTGSVAIGIANPATSAALDVTSTNKGFLPPRMTNAEMKAIATPENGLMVYNTTLNCMAYYVDGSYNCLHNQPVQPAPPAPLGSTISQIYNGITSEVNIDNSQTTYTTGEIFNQNTECNTAMISSQGCGGLTQVTGVSGTVYPLLNINGQCWMQTNLKEIPSNFASYTPTSWLLSSPGDQGFWGFYNSVITDGSAGFSVTESIANAGYLYQWSAAMNNSVGERSRGVCPEGFHIPSDCEWKYLEHGQGMSITEQNRIDAWRANSISQGTPGNKLRSEGTNQNNASGFSVMLSGYRFPSGGFGGVGGSTFFWTSTVSDSANTITRRFNTGRASVFRSIHPNDHGFYVRCLKD